jgi:hypothetical protein
MVPATWPVLTPRPRTMHHQHQPHDGLGVQRQNHPVCAPQRAIADQAPHVQIGYLRAVRDDRSRSP